MLGQLLSGSSASPNLLETNYTPRSADVCLNPRHPFHPNATIRTRNTTWCIEKKHLVTPQGNKLNTTDRQRVVTRPLTRLHTRHTTGRLFLCGYSSTSSVGTNASSTQRTVPYTKYKRLEFLNTIEDSLDMNPIPFLLIEGCSTPPSSEKSNRMHHPGTSKSRKNITLATCSL
ncbi:hypothetical protein SAMN05421754_10892 [Nitrosomonas sp. Nm58]|nr:hypothetical protein SAMN05421754_10892 [Nitrosomonas sp. Nm58]